MHNLLNVWSPVWLLIGYLFGSVPVSYLVAKWIFHVDLKEAGIGDSPTPSRLGRLCGAKAMAIALPGELGKAFLAVATANYFSGNPWLVSLAAIGAVIGHCKNIWLGWRGGKAMSAGLGALLAIWLLDEPNLGWFLLPTVPIAFVAWWATWRVSMASISGALLALSFSITLLLGRKEIVARPYLLLLLVGSLFALSRLWGNLVRLITGSEHETNFLWTSATDRIRPHGLQRWLGLTSAN